MPEVRLKGSISSGTALRIRKLGLEPGSACDSIHNVQTTEIMDHCISTELKLPSQACPVFPALPFIISPPAPSFPFLPLCLVMPLTVLADTWLDSPLCTCHTPCILHESHKKSNPSLKAVKAYNPNFLALSYLMIMLPQ